MASFVTSACGLPIKRTSLLGSLRVCGLMHLVGILLSTLCFMNSAVAQTDQILPALGGLGGGQFLRPLPAR